MDRRRLLILAVPVGLALGAGLWMATGMAGPGRKVETLQTRLASLPRGRTPPVRSGDGLSAQIIASPLFGAVGGQAMREVAIKLEGLVRAPGRAAALLSVDGGPSQWLAVGQSMAGVTLQALSDSGATVDTAMGERDIALGATSGQAPTAAASPTTFPSDQPPPGYRGPPPPASAPGGVQ